MSASGDADERSRPHHSSGAAGEVAIPKLTPTTSTRRGRSMQRWARARAVDAILLDASAPKHLTEISRCRCRGSPAKRARSAVRRRLFPIAVRNDAMVERTGLPSRTLPVHPRCGRPRARGIRQRSNSTRWRCRSTPQWLLVLRKECAPDRRRPTGGRQNTMRSRGVHRPACAGRSVLLHTARGPTCADRRDDRRARIAGLSRAHAKQPKEAGGIRLGQIVQSSSVACRAAGAAGRRHVRFSGREAGARCRSVAAGSRRARRCRMHLSRAAGRTRSGAQGRPAWWRRFFRPRAARNPVKFRFVFSISRPVPEAERTFDKEALS